MWARGAEVLGVLSLPYCDVINRRITSPSLAAERRSASLPDLVFLFLSCSPSWVGVGNTKHETKTEPNKSIRCVGIALKEGRKYCQCCSFCTREDFFSEQ